jgi:hypothetical protein
MATFHWKARQTELTISSMLKGLQPMKRTSAAVPDTQLFCFVITTKRNSLLPITHTHKSANIQPFDILPNIMHYFKYLIFLAAVVSASSVSPEGSTDLRRDAEDSTGGDGSLPGWRRDAKASPDGNGNPLTGEGELLSEVSELRRTLMKSSWSMENWTGIGLS